MTQTNNDKHTILVVDDDPDISMMLKLMLEYKGYRVLVLDKPDIIIQTINENDISIVIIDMLLSGLNGTDVCGEIRKHASTAACPILMISAHPNAKKICLEAGADDFIAKPFDMSEILTKISGLIKVTR